MSKWLRIAWRKLWLRLGGRKFIEFGRGKPRWKIIEFVEKRNGEA